MSTRTICFVLLRAASLILSLSGGCASAIPFPNFDELKLNEQRVKIQADLVIEAKPRYYTYFFEEERTKLPPIAATYRRWLHLDALSVERNELSRIVPSSLALDANDDFPESPLKCISNPTILFLAGGPPCREWKWFPYLQIPGTPRNEMAVSFDAKEPLKLWLKTSYSNRNPIDKNQDVHTFRVIGLAAEKRESTAKRSNTYRENAVQAALPCLSSLICIFSPCTPQQRINNCINLPDKTDKYAKQDAPLNQLVLGGYITEEVDSLHVTDGRNYFVVLGYHVYTSGGILGNGGTDRTGRQGLADLRAKSDPHYIPQNIHDSFKIGDYVYLSCSVGDLESMSCALDSANKGLMITFSKAWSESWMPDWWDLNQCFYGSLMIAG